jgi:hypothetical protein
MRSHAGRKASCRPSVSWVSDPGTPHRYRTPRSPTVAKDLDREQPVSVVSTGSHPARMIMRARVLLALADGAGAAAVAR